MDLIAENGVPLSGPQALPFGWEAVCPNSALAPVFSTTIDSDGQLMITSTGNGRRECFGYVRRTVDLHAGRAYRLSVSFRCAGLKDVNRHLKHGVWAQGFNNGIFTYRRSGAWVVGENRFEAMGNVDGAEVRLYFRYSANGSVQWKTVNLEECDPIAPRVVKVAGSSGKGDLTYWSNWLDRVGQKHVDIALLPEFFNNKNADAPEPIDGPASQLLAAKAAQWHMYVCGTFYEKRGDMVFNTAPLFSCQGELLGSYCKNQLFDPEADAGVTPGTGYPVFTTDFGKVGIMTCYDSWFPESARLLAYKGAELVLFPNAGYYTAIMPARAADNGIWIVASSKENMAGIWEPAGGFVGGLTANPTRHAPITSVVSCEIEEGTVIAEIDLTQKISPHWWGGPMHSAPGARRVRQTLIEPVEPQIAEAVSTWYDE